MKLFVCHLLLPPLLLLFGCHRLAAVHGKVDADNQLNIKNTTPRLEAMRSDLEEYNERLKDQFLTTISSRADTPCPVPAVIAPCTCTVDAGNTTAYIDCTLVESVDQLVEVFNQDFPVTELYEFVMMNNSAINELPSFMNGVTFERVSLNPGPFILTSISDQFLLDLKDTLKDFLIFDSQLTTNFFPFSMLPSMSQLESLRIYFSDIDTIPPIQGPKLTIFALELSPLQLLVSGTFSIGTGATDIWVTNNQIQTIEAGSFFFADQNSADSNERMSLEVQSNQLQSLEAGTFPLRNGPMFIRLYLNQISSIEPGTFVLPAETAASNNQSILIDLFANSLQSLTAGTFPLRNGPMTIGLSSNQISSIEPGVFVLPVSTDLLTIGLDLRNNELPTVDEEVFRSLMPFLTYLAVLGNPLTCDCDMAWLFLNEDFLATVVDADDPTCANGTYLHELDPQAYIDFC